MDAFLPPGSPMHRTIGDLEYAGVSSVTVPTEPYPSTPRYHTAPVAPSLGIHPMPAIVEALAQEERDDPLNQAFHGTRYPAIKPIAALQESLDGSTPRLELLEPGILAPPPASTATKTAVKAAAASRTMDWLKITK